MEGDKIKYSDLISPDDSITNLVAQLTELNKTYGAVLEVVRTGAKDIIAQLKSMSSATSSGRAEIDEASIAANKLAKAQRDLAFSMTDVGKQVAWLKSQTASQNKMSVEQQKWSQALVGSYDRLKFQIKDLTKRYKELDAAERASEKGERILGQLLDKKQKLAELDSQMKLHVETLSAVEKAEKKLEFLRSEEGQRLLELKRLINEEVAAHRTERASIDEVAQAQQRLEAAMSERRIAAHQLNQQAKEADKIAKLEAQILNSKEGSYNRLAAQYALNKIKLDAMSASERQATDAGKKLEAETQALYVQMTKLQEAVGNHRLSVGHYAKSWDGLGISVSQVVRELPAAAVSMNTFFLGISNNIPILVDEINKLREANRRAVAEGKPTKSVIGAITSSLLGWNTVLVVGLTLLSMHGKAIIDWVSTLIRGGKAAMTATELVETLNEELKNNTAALGDNIVSVHKLSQEWKSLATKKEQLQWIRDNKSEFDQLNVSVKNVSDAENIFVKHTDTMITALKLRAKATAAYSAAAKKYEESFIKQQEAEAMANREASFFENLAGSSLFAGLGILNPSLIGPIAQSGLTEQSGEFIKNTLIEQKREEAKAAEADAKALYELGEANAKLAAEELKRAGIEQAHKYKKDRTRTPRERDLTDAINRMALATQKKYEQSITALERDEYDKRRKEAVDAANVKIRELKETYRKNEEYLADEKNRYEELTEDEVKMVQNAQKQIRKTINNIQAQLAYDLTQIRKDELIEQQRILEKSIELRLEAVKKGSKEELELRLEAAKIAQNIALLENSKKPIDQQQRSEDIIAGFGKQQTGLRTDFAMTEFDQQQALDSAKFNEVARSEYELTRFKLEQEKARWEKQIALAKEGALDWSNIQIQEAESVVNGINRELNELKDPFGLIGKKGLGGALLTKLGFDDKQIAALDQAVNTVLDNLQSILDAEVELAEAAVEAAEKRVEAAQSAYDAEIEARNNGYANNVATAKKELQQEKKNRQEKQKLLEQAQKRQEAVNTVIQASSLVTASANIWSSLSSIPVVGPALALAAIATMWTSFAVAKVKAKQVTAASSEEYGEGGLEFLEGGSHASGNDIDLATKNSRGKNMRAEGGEALAIINKKQTRRYRKQLPDIINSLNKGTFEDKYLRAFESGETLQAQIVAAQTNIDLSRVEQDVAEIKKQNSVRYYPVGDGSMLMIKGNVKCYIR